MRARPIGRPSDPERSARTAILIDVSPTNETRRCEDVVATVQDVERAFGADFGPGVRFSLSCP